MYEHRTQPLLSRMRFARRLAGHGLVAATVTVFSLVIGVLGFHAADGMGWLDAFVNASMLLGGMGAIGGTDTPAGKWFSAFYALYAGIVFIVVSGILTAPVLHRVLHRFHLENR